MAIITGTEGDDDGISAPALFGTGGDTVLGLGGDDVISSGGWLGGSSAAPAVLIGGTGSDSYSIGPAFSYPVYSTPIYWVTVWSNATVHENPWEAGFDHVEAQGATLANTTLAFDGTDLVVTTLHVFSPTVPVTTPRTIRLADNFAVDDAGTLLAGVESLALGTALTLDLRSASSLMPFLIAGTAGAETLEGGAGADLIDAGAGDDLIRAGAGRDLATGGAGDDRLRGGADDDRLHGGAGNDRLLGGQGDDALHGGTGRDGFRGGAGADAFHFGAGQDSGHILDFGRGADLLVLTGLFADAATALAALTTNAAGDAVLAAAGTRIVLAGIDPATLTEADILIA